jgi:hypothetical protein
MPDRSAPDRSAPDQSAPEQSPSKQVPPEKLPPEQSLAENRVIASQLEEIATLLAHQGAIEFRVRAYRAAAETVHQMEVPLRSIFEREGVEGLISIPTIGQSIAHVIEQFLRSGRMVLLDRLRGEETAERLFASLPGLGRELARRIHEQLEIETLPELMATLADGRLQKVPGMGKKRLRAIRESLSVRLRHPDVTESRRFQPDTQQSDRVPVSELLDVDSQYRRLATQGKLPRIAPIRFNPQGTAWLPILHTHRGDRHYTALYSNTARAHELNTTRDWVVIYRDDSHAQGRWTVITSQFGKLRGWRIVRGREDDCAEYYLHHHPNP